jgi:hypothetical protein
VSASYAKSMLCDVDQLVFAVCRSGPYGHVRDLIGSGEAWFPWGYRTSQVTEAAKSAMHEGGRQGLESPLPMSRAFIYPLTVATSAWIFERASRIIAEHRVACFLVTAGAIILMWDATRRVLPDETETSLFTWVLLGLMAYSIVALVYVRKRFPVDVRNVFAYGMAVSPAFYGFAAALFGSPVVVMWIGAALAIVLTGFVVFTATLPATEN